MRTFRVQWEIDIEAEDEVEAAEKGRAYQLNPEAQVGHFVVVDERGKLHEIDLDERTADSAYARAETSFGEGS